jgi:hypothetical protein
LNDAATNRDALIRYVQKAEKLAVTGTSPWSFRSGIQAKVWFDSGATSSTQAPISGLRFVGSAGDGYIRYELTLK